MMKQYGRNFYMRVVSACPPHAPWPDDLQVPFTDISDLMSQHVGIGLYKRALKKGHLTLSKEMQKLLENELNDEKCTLQKASNGDLERVVALVVLDLRRSDGYIFTQVGKYTLSGGVKVSVELPGKKRSM